MLGCASVAFSQDVTQLPTITVNGIGDRLCLPIGTTRDEGDQRPFCVGEGINRGNVAGNTFDQQQLKRFPTGSQAQDYVKRLPGVATGGAPGEDKDARVLGLDKEYTRTTIDGIALPDGGEKREFNLDTIPAAWVDSVEVVRGRRADMDADGIAGIIEVKLRDIPETPEWEMKLGVGKSDNGVGLYDLALVGGGMVDASIGGQFGLTSARNTNGKTKEKLRADGTVSETEDEAKTLTSLGALGDFLWQDANNAIHFKPMVLTLTEDKDKTKEKFNTSGVLTGSEREEETKEKTTAGASLSWRHDFAGVDGASLELQASHYSTTEDKDKTKSVYNAAGVENLGNRETETELKQDVVTQGKLDLTLPTEIAGLTHTFKSGLTVRDKSRTKDKSKTKGGVAQSLSDKDVYAIDEVVWGAYVLDEIQLTDWLEVTPGLRIEGSSVTSSMADGTTGSGDTIDLLPSLPVHLTLDDAWSIDGGIARLVNRPKFDAIIPVNSDTLLGNPDLNPEHGWAFDASLNYKTDDVELTFGVFHRQISDLMEEVDTGLVNDDEDTIYQIQNVGDGWTNGLILSQRVALAGLIDIPVLEGFSLFSTQTLTWSEVTLEDGTQRRFKDQPPYFLDLALEWTDPTGAFSASAAMGYTPEMTTGDNANETRDAEFSLDLAANYQIDETFSIYALAKNVTGTERVKHKADGTTESERGSQSFLVGMKAKF
jgi:outer membrane receptor for ferrienterochelin and colicin